MINKREKKFNSWLIDRIIGGSYLGERWEGFFKKLKNIGLEAYAHLLTQLQRFKERYRN